MLLPYVFGDTQARILYVHLDQYLTVPIVKLSINLYAPVHVGRTLNLTFTIQFERGVNAAYVLSADKCDSGNSGAYGEMFPILPRYLCRAEGTRKNRSLHIDFLIQAVFFLRIHIGEFRGIRITFNAIRQALGAQRITLDVQMGIIHRIIFVASGCYLTERPGINNFAAPE